MLIDYFMSIFQRIQHLRIYSVVMILSCTSHMHGQTISEKKAGISPQQQDMTAEMQKTLVEVNRELLDAQNELHQYYASVNELFLANASPEAYHSLLVNINEARRHLTALEEHWREVAVQGGKQESYALWHQPETTIGELVMDYGSQGYVYMVPPEVDSITLSVNSNLPIPRSSWEEMLDLILVQNGVGYRQLNPFLRQLFLLKENKSGLKLITNNRKDLELFEPNARICFMLTPEPAEARRAWLFLDKFVNPNSTLLQMLGRNILIIGQVSEVQDLLKLYDFIAANKGDKEYRIFPVRRIDVDEMASILGAIFDQSSGPVEQFREPSSMQQFGDRGGESQDSSRNGPQGVTQGALRGGYRPPGYTPSFAQDRQNDVEANGLKIITLTSIAKALFLVGTKEEIKKAEQIIQQMEAQAGEARERVIYWYTVKHSDAEELAEVLQKIYLLMIKTGASMREGFSPEGFPVEMAPLPTTDSIANEIIAKERALLPSEMYQTSYYQQGNYVVNPAPVEPRKTTPPPVNKNRDNFIVDPKTGSIAMVVEADLLPKIKDLIKKLDVAKRMVQIEVLLFERRIRKQNNFGLNLLKIGDCASQITETCLKWNDPLTIPTGILEFIFKRKESCGLPAYDATFRFLMTQDDIQINASPSVVAINQTPATVAIVEEMSINTGIYNVETVKGITLEKAFTRAQYGITIDMTPTIHITEEDGGEGDEPNYVTLDTDVTFDTVQGGLAPERPDVTRRHIANHVRVPDGQTIILGGLRRKLTDEFKESIPFFGELPAIGKLFGQRRYEDTETEMFIFLTPTIISDPLDDFEKIKCAEMQRRPGDIPEFLCSLNNARIMEKDRLLVNSMVILLGPEPDRCYTPSYWRPSTCGAGFCNAAAETQWNATYLPISDEYDGR